MRACLGDAFPQNWSHVKDDAKMMKRLKTACALGFSAVCLWRSREPRLIPQGTWSSARSPLTVGPVHRRSFLPPGFFLHRDSAIVALRDSSEMIRITGR